MKSQLLPLLGVTNFIFLRRDEVAALCETEAILRSCDVLCNALEGRSVAGAVVALSYDGAIVLRRFHRLERTSAGGALVHVEEGREVDCLSNILAQDPSDQEWHKAASDMTRRIIRKEAGPITLTELRDICRSLILLHRCALVLAADAVQHGAKGGGSRGSYRYGLGYISGTGADGAGIAGEASLFSPRAVAERCRDKLLAVLRSPPVPDDILWADYCVALRKFLWSPVAAEQVAADGRLVDWPQPEGRQKQEEEQEEEEEEQEERQQQGQQQQRRDAGNVVDAVGRVVQGQQHNPACALPSRQPEHLRSPGQPPPVQDACQEHVFLDAGQLGDEPPPQRHARKRHGRMQVTPEPRPASPCHGPVTQEPVRTVEQEARTLPGPGSGQALNCGHDRPFEKSLKPVCVPGFGVVGAGQVPGPGHAPGPDPTTPGVDPGKGAGAAEVTTLSGCVEDCQSAGASPQRTQREAHPQAQAPPGPGAGRGWRSCSPSRVGPGLEVSQCSRPRITFTLPSPPRARSNSPPAAGRGGWAGRGGGSGGPGPREGPGRRSGVAPEEGPSGKAPRHSGPDARGKAPEASKPCSPDVWSWRVYNFLLKQPDRRANPMTLQCAKLGIPDAELRRTGMKPSTYLYQYGHLWTVTAKGESPIMQLVARPPEEVEAPPGLTQQLPARRRYEEGTQWDGSDEWDRGKRQRCLGQESSGRLDGGGWTGLEEGAARPDGDRQPDSVPGRPRDTNPRRRSPHAQVRLQQPRQQHEQPHRAHLVPPAENPPRWRRDADPSSDAATLQGRQQQQLQQQQQRHQQQRQQQAVQSPPGGRAAKGRTAMPPGFRAPVEWQQQQRRDAWEPGRDGARDSELTREEHVSARRAGQQAHGDRGRGLSGREALPRGRVDASHFESEEERNVVERICGVLRQHPEGMALVELARRGYAIPAEVLRRRGPAAWAKRHACIWSISALPPVILTLLPDREVTRGGAGA